MNSYGRTFVVNRVVEET
jgi:hypothetical protein